MNEKELVETRNAKVAQMENILNTAKVENRAVTDEENAKFENLEKEVKNIDRTIALNERMQNVSLREVPKTEVAMAEMTNEEKDAKVFENMIRNYKNETFTTKADGQATIPSTIASKIIDKVIEISPIFRLADRYNIKGKITLPKYNSQTSTLSMQYVAEGTSATPNELKLTNIELDGYLASTLSYVSNSLINNSAFDIVGFVIAKMAQAIALFIEGELLKGTEGKVEGLSTIPASMIVTTESATAITTDELMDVKDKVIDKYQGASIWIMNRTTRSAIRKLKDREGQYLLNKDLNSKWGYTLLGRDVYCSDQVDGIDAGNTAIFYGDFSGLAVKVSEDVEMKILDQVQAINHLTTIVAFIEFDAKLADEQKIAKLVLHTA